MTETNEFGQPLGASVPQWEGAQPLDFRQPLKGSEVSLVPIDPEKHVDGLLQPFGQDDGSMWTYTSFTGPYTTRASLLAELQKLRGMRGTAEFYTIMRLEGSKPVGIVAYLRNFPKCGNIEIGYVTFSPILRRSRASTEAIFLLMQNAFNAGYRRLEWKCDSLNANSTKAALRYGFKYEGMMRNAVAYVLHQRTRDTTWLSMTAAEWNGGVRDAIAKWLDPSNFDPNGQQVKGLATYVERDPNGKLDPRKPRLNKYGQSIGASLENWAGAREICRSEVISGTYVDLVPIDPEAHAEGLLEALREDDGSMWTYLSFGNMSKNPTLQSIKENLSRMQTTSDECTWFYAIVNKGNKNPEGWVSYSRCNRQLGVIEIGDVTYSPRLRQTTRGTEAIYLLLNRAFLSGFRRVSWSCDSLNSRSRKAASRCGFTYEIISRQASVVKGRNRDTAWYAITDTDWDSKLRTIYQSWLDPSNFLTDGKQKKRLQDFLVGSL